MLNRCCSSILLSKLCKNPNFQRTLSTFVVQHKFHHRFSSYSRKLLSTSTSQSEPSSTASEPPTGGILKVDTTKVNKLVDQLFCLNIIEMNQLMTRLQAKVGLSDEELEKRMFPSGSAGGATPSGDEAVEAEVKKEKDVFTVKLGAVDAKAKIKIIKEVRTITGLGLKEAKDLVEKAPTVLKEGLKKEEAEAMKKVLEEAGAKVELE